MAAMMLLLAASPQAALAGETLASETEPGGTAREAGLPFSTGDLGWVFLAAVVLLVLMVGLQLVVRRRRALRSLARERTDP